MSEETLRIIVEEVEALADRAEAAAARAAEIRDRARERATKRNNAPRLP